MIENQPLRSNEMDPSYLVMGLGTSGKEFIEKLKLVAPKYLLDKSITIEGMDSFTTGCDGSDFDRDAITQQLRKASKVLIVVFGGGQSGADMCKFAATQARARGISVNVVLSTPMNWEGRQRAQKTKALIDEIHDYGIPVLLISGDSQDDPDEEDYKVLFTRISDQMQKAIDDWIKSLDQ